MEKKRTRATARNASPARSKPAEAPYHHGALREALVEAAIELLRDVGVEDLSLRDTAKAVGVTPSATYRHFESKADLLTAVAAVGVDKLGQRLRRRVAEVTRARDGEGRRAVAIARFEEAGRTYVAFAIDHPNLFRVMYGPSGICRMETSAEPGHHGGADTLGEVLDELVAVGILPAGRRSGGEFRLWTVVHGFAALVVGGAPIFPTAALRAAALEELLAFALDGLCGRRVADG